VEGLAQSAREKEERQSILAMQLRFNPMRLLPQIRALMVSADTEKAKPRMDRDVF